MYCKSTPRHSVFVCGEQDCNRHYYSSDSFKKHLVREHQPSFANHEENHANPEINSTVQIQSNARNLDLPSTSTAFSRLESIKADDNSIDYHALNMISSLHANPMIPRKTVQVFLESLKTYLKESENSLLNRFHSMIPPEKIDIDLDKAVKKTLQVNSETFKAFDTEHKCLKHFKQLGTYLESREIVVGQRLETKHTSTGFSMIQVPCTEQILPLKDVLEKFFSLPCVLKDTLAYLGSIKRNPFGIENIIQGSVCENKIQSFMEIESEMVLPLIVYFDDFEVGNPLGSHAGIHKLGGVYVSLPCLPPRYVSQLKHIFILALFHSSDRYSCGNNMIFTKVIEELNNLKNNGVKIESEVFKGTIKFYVAAVTGDNLGLNGILGFVESFSANRPCRICNANKEQIKSLYFEDDELLRNNTNYTHDLQIHNVFETGIKEECVWLALEEFNLFENVAVDVMHDYLEGCCRYVMTFIITNLIQTQRLISLEMLNSKLRFFDYGPDSTSKPSNPVTKDGSCIKLKVSASEMLTLVRYFGIIVGMNVPDNNDVWSLYIKLRQLLDKLMSRRIHDNTADQVKFLVAELNELYCELTETYLKPKFHFLTHYPAMLKKFGPLTQIWAMRFEAKHRISKFVARASCSRVNICKTIAIKNQLVLNDLFLKNNPPCNISSGKNTKIPDLEIESLTRFTNNTSTNWYSTSRLKLNGIDFNTSSILVFDIIESTGLPLFAEVEKIYTCDDKVVFKCRALESIDFSFHYYAFEVKKTNNYLYCFHDNLVSPVPCTLTLLRNLKYYVTVRWTLD